jgi:predicted phage tail protein
MINPSQHKPTGVPPPSDEEHQRRVAWITRVRNMHQNKRMVGLAGIILGAALVAWSRFTPDAPPWALATGFTVLGVSWALFIYVIVDRWLWVKRNPYKPNAGSVAT